MKLFLSPASILSEIETMERAENNRREDRATVSEFFNGAPPLTDEEAKELGLNINVNNLFGYTDLASSREQLFSLLTKPDQMYRVELDACPVANRTGWEMEVTAALNEPIKRSKRFKNAYLGACGDAALHGEGVMNMRDRTDWCPSHTPLSKILIPDDAPTDIAQITHWCIEAELTISKLNQYQKDDSEGWKVGNIRKILRKLYRQADEGEIANNSDPMNVEDLEYKRQTNSGNNGEIRRRPTVRVYYFYQVRSDKKGEPVDLTILLHRLENLLEDDRSDAKKDEDKVLYEEECCYESVKEILKPFFVDCIIGGSPMWHRVLGTGHLNYQLNHAVEILLNRSMQGTLEGMMNLWKAKDSAQREEIQQILARHNGVIPENIDLIQQRFQPDIPGTLGMIQFYRQQGSKNVRGVTPNLGEAKLLEVQAVEEGNQAREQTGSRMANWYDDLDGGGETILARFTNPLIRPCDAGYSDILKFQSRMARLDIDLFWLQPHNVRVRAVRIIGDGDTAKEREGALFLTQNKASYPPEAQNEILRISTAVFTGSYELANRLVPSKPDVDHSQILAAQSENNVAIVQGVPPMISDEDIDDVHFPIHLDGMVRIIQRSAQFNRGAFTPVDFMSFQALGAHTVAHIHKIESMVGPGKKDVNKAKSAQWMQSLNEVVALGEKLAHNMQQAMQAQQGEQADPMDVAKLQLQAEQLRLSREKFEFSTEKWGRQQNLRENQSAFDQMLNLEKHHVDTKVANARIVQADATAAKALAAPKGEAA